MELTITRARMASSHFGRETGGEAHWHYYCTGPDTITTVDGRVLPRKFDNSSVVTLRGVLTRTYGRGVKFVQTF